MPYAPLAAVKHRLAVGCPLPFNVLDRDGRLLLAKGRLLETTERMDTLLARGTLVDIVELFRNPDAIRRAPRALLPALWRDNRQQVDAALRKGGHPEFRAALDDASAPVLTLVDRDPDLAIFQILRQDAGTHLRYGLDHAMHTAIVCRLVAHRLGWPEDEATRAFKAALTMNLSILELQGQLAAQATPPTASQRRQIALHPAHSREMLQTSGVTDAVWLDAVEQHHERPDGSGYPNGMTTPSELATLLHCADTYTSKLHGRATREAVAADRAGREIFMSDPTNPVHAALVKEFGVYPPGCFVELASGETGFVVARGPTVMAPVVSVLASADGRPLRMPVRRDTTDHAFAVSRVIPTPAAAQGLDLAQLLVG